MATGTVLRLATLITFAISCSLQVEYKAAVLEYEVNTGYGNVEELLHENAQNYVRYIRDAASQDTDIIVFPESTLNNGFSADRDKTIQNAFFLPDPSLNVAPCDSDEYHQVLTALSCEARRSRIYVVINVSEKRSCPDGPDPRPCSGDGYNLYNSNVVFDRDGRIVSRYRKTRLFGESGFNVTSSPEVEVFTTDFNVTFAHLICFDMMFPHPAATFLQRGVKNVIVPMMWYSELPFLTAVQYQQAWSFSRGVNLLAAGSNRPASGCGGSGVYSGRGGPRAALLAGDTRSALLVATLDSEPSNEVFEGTTAESVRPEGMAMLRDQLDHYSWKQINVWAAGGSDTSICHSDFCCKITTKATVTEVDPSEESYTYLAVAYDGVRTYSGVTTGGVQTCGVIACKGTDITTCGKMFTSAAIRNNIEFEEISVTGTFRKLNSIQFPVSLQGDLLPLGPNRFNYHVADYKYDADYSQVTMNLTGTVDDLLTFAIFGRDFSKDGLPITEKEIIKKSVKNTQSIKAYSMKISNADVPENKTNLIENKPVYTETQDDGSVFKFIDYIPVKLQILIAVVSIYCLEQL